ncbi:MAG: EcoKI restriction-modification system protein HsdS [Candidatus Brocadia fulgida]|uniref:EcoKI restriction-modification system protein HsdS n=1 Tax=Candidatus Brocadia fulgida TaxID=380242 RepID=A0A0M2USU2_9BACT|nr:MAG: EcoKI restriction-modification system protein HsdS [Candidatus Brocadia fulgida]
MSNGKLKMDNCQLPTVNSKFKRTEVGGIPNDWEVKRIDECSKICVGRDLIEAHYSPIQDHKYRYPIYSNTVDNRGLYGYYDIEEYKGESLTVVGRGVGLGTAFKRDGGYGAIGRLLILFPLEKYDASFLTEYINHRVKIFEESSGIPQLTSVSLSKYKIPLPPTKAEQTTIAAALSDADALITQLEKLIAKKRNIKRGAMHELLTGQKRLPGFEIKKGYKQTEIGVVPNDWEIKKLGEVVEKFVNGGTPSTQNENYWAGHIPWITGADILNQRVSEIRRYITKEALKNSATNVIEKGTLLLVSRTGVGKLAIAPFDIAISQDFTGVYVNNKVLQTEYLYRYFDFKSSMLQSQNQGTSIKGITRDTLASIKIPLPTKAEQAAIAQVLSDMDAEIEALEKKLEKYKMIKQGMMQNLLTGKIRLV